MSHDYVPRYTKYPVYFIIIRDEMITMVDDSKIMILDGYDQHHIGDIKCDTCWAEYPVPCICGGLIHATFGDESYDGDYWLHTQCDMCGEPESP